jgi:hypothetical protein
MPLTDRKYTMALVYASGTADREGAALDMSGYQEVDVVFQFGTIEAAGTNSIKVQCDDNASFTSAQDIAGTAQTVAHDDDGQIFIVNIVNPPERYIRAYVDKDTSHACAETVTYVQHMPGRKPQTNDVANLVTTESHVGPATGTA